MNPRNFFVEPKRRNVYKVAVAYAVVAWLLVQQVFPFLKFKAILLISALNSLKSANLRRKWSTNSFAL